MLNIDRQELKQKILKSLYDNGNQSATQLSKNLNVLKNEINIVLKLLEQESLVKYCGGHKWDLTETTRNNMSMDNIEKPVRKLTNDFYNLVDSMTELDVSVLTVPTIKILRNKMNFQEKHEELFKDVVFIVEANSFEKLCLWLDHWHEPRKGYLKVESWEDDCGGWFINIGEINGRQINISIFHSYINGKKVMFYECVSQLVDHKMVEEWLKHYSFDKIRWDNNSRWAHCDAMNFHHCIEAINVKDKNVH